MTTTEPTADLDEEPTTPIDGRSARRQRNIDAVVDATLSMFAEESMFPTMEQVAQRSGLSLRSLYRYFADPADLLDEAIRRTQEIGNEFSQLDDPGEGPLEQRVADFAAMRLRLFERMAPVYRATMANAARHPRILANQTRARDRLRAQFELQFAPELSAMSDERRQAALSAGDVLTQFDSLDFMRRHRELSIAATESVLVASLTALLS